jgi:hypothetical protein
MQSHGFTGAGKTTDEDEFHCQVSDVRYQKKFGRLCRQKLPTNPLLPALRATFLKEEGF